MMQVQAYACDGCGVLVRWDGWHYPVGWRETDDGRDLCGDCG